MTPQPHSLLPASLLPAASRPPFAPAAQMPRFDISRVFPEISPSGTNEGRAAPEISPDDTSDTYPRVARRYFPTPKTPSLNIGRRHTDARRAIFPDRSAPATFTTTAHYVMLVAGGTSQPIRRTIITTEKKFACEDCAMRRQAEARPRSLMARLWRWHTTWCPGWKAYQAYLKETGRQPTAPPPG